MKRVLTVRAELSLILLTVLAPLFALVGYGYVADLRDARWHAAERLQESARIIAADEASRLADIQALLARVARRPLVQAVASARCDPWLGELEHLHPEFADAGILDPSGRLVCSVVAARGPGPFTVIDRSLFLDPVLRSGHAVVSKPFIGPLTRRWVVVIALPIRDASGRTQGVLAAALDLARSQPRDWYLSLRATRRAAIEIFDSSGTVIARLADAEKWIGKTISGKTSAIEAILARPEAEGTLEARGADGARRVYGFATVAGTGWRVSVGSPAAVVYARPDASALRNGILAALIVLAVAGAGLLAAERVRRPIRRVSAATGAVGRGDFDIRLPAQEGPSELRELAGELNRMLDVRTRIFRSLEESEARFRQLAENVREVFWVKDPGDGAIQYVSPAYETVWGRSGANLSAAPGAWPEAVHPEDRQRVAEALRVGQALGGYDEEYRIVRPDGSVRWIRDRAFPVTRDGVLERIVGVADDVTERKAQELALRRLNRTLGVLSECNQILVRTATEDELLQKVCGALVDLGGYRLAWVGYAEHGPDKRVRPMAQAGPSASYLQGLELTWADEEGGRGPTGRAIRGGRPIVAHDTSADPTYAGWQTRAHEYGFRSSASLPLIAGGETLGVLNLYSPELEAFDADEMRLLVELADDLAFGIRALRAHEQRARLQAEQQTMLDTASVGIAFLRNRRIVRCNRGFAEMFGYAADEMAGMSTRELHVSDAAYEEVGREVPAALRQSGHFRGERQYRRRDGSLFWVYYDLVALDRADPERGVFWTGHDITERKRIERELRESEARLRLTLEATRIGIWDWDMREDRWVSTPAYFQMLGYEPSAEAQDRKVWGERTHPEDRERVVATMVAVRDAGLPGFDIEFRFRHADGSYRWVNSIGRAVELDAQGRATRMLGLQIDITERKMAELRHHQMEELLRELTANIPEGYWVRDVQSGVLLYVSPVWQQITGSAPPIGAPYGRLFEPIHPGDRERMMRAVAAAPLGGVDGECRMVNADGTVRWVRARTFPIRNEAGEVYRVGGVAEDITEKKATEAARREADELLHELAINLPEAFWVREAASGRFLYVSPGWKALTGRDDPADLQDVWDAVHPDDRARARGEALARPTGGVDHEYRFLRANGEVRWLRARSFPIRDRTGEVYRVVAMLEDVTQRKEAEERLLKLAHYDHLTDLPNRAYFSEALQRLLDQARQSGWGVGVLFVDLDRFKGVNDTLGHAAGDELLRQVAMRLLDCVRVRDVVGRMGGDEYALALPALDRPEDAGTIARKILQAFARPFEVGGRELFITASIGITTAPTDTDLPGELLRYADTAMYQAKQEGRNTYRFYTAEMNLRAAERLEMEGLLRRALERNEFLLHYQPKLDLQSGAVSGVEALLRWRRPEAGLVSPGAFIPLLEETGMIVQVGEWVVGEACRQLRSWQAERLNSLRIAVNLSARQFREPNLAQSILRAAAGQAIDPQGLEIEITESALMSDHVRVVAELSALRAAGMRIALDDFGTGYSSLSYLKRFPIDTVKIDQSFVRGLPGGADDAAIALSVIGIGRSLGLKVVAEGVETEAQLEFMRVNGCDEIQGYYFARPMEAGQVAAFLRQRTRRG